MAYNPLLYSPYGSMQPYSWSQPAQQPINGLVSVTGIEGAKAYSLPPNSSMPLFDADDDVLYVKTTDAAGYPTIKTFAFKSVEEPKHAAEVQADYVPRSEFDALVAQVRELIDRPVNGKRARDGE